MACNIPVVSTNVGDVKILLEGVHGSYVSSSNSVEELTKLTINSLNCQNINSRQILIQKKLDIQSVALELKNIYSGIINN